MIEMRVIITNYHPDHRWRDKNGNEWYWTGHTWECDAYLHAVIRETLPKIAEPYTKVT